MLSLVHSEAAIAYWKFVFHVSLPESVAIMIFITSLTSLGILCPKHMRKCTLWIIRNVFRPILMKVIGVTRFRRWAQSARRITARIASWRRERAARKQAVRKEPSPNSWWVFVKTNIQQAYAAVIAAATTRKGAFAGSLWPTSLGGGPAHVALMIIIAKSDRWDLRLCYLAGNAIRLASTGGLIKGFIHVLGL